MNIHKLLEKAESFLNAEERKRKEKKKYLKKVIKKLKKHEHALIEQLETGSREDDRVKIEQEIALAHAQRKKGLAKLKELKKVKKPDSTD